MDTKSFFGPNGLTSASANHYANLAKECARKIQNYLSSVKFYSTRLSVIGDNKGGVVSNGAVAEDLDSIEQAATHLTNLHSLIAFFREAIKEKERLTNEAQNYEDKEAHANYLAASKELDEKKPKHGHEDYITEDDVIESWSIGEQEKYLSLEAEASVYGKLVHEDGSLSNARIDLMKRIDNPISVKEGGRDTLIYNYEPTVDLEAVDRLYFKLQKHFREVQAELNGMKKKIEDTITAQKLEVDEKYRIAYESWKADKNALERELQLVYENESKKRMALLEEVKNLKIVVPNRLKETLEGLKSM